MLHYFKFNQSLYSPAPAKPTYHKPGPGKGWPEECPPIRSANSFGYDILANFDITFVQKKTGWAIEKPVSVTSDFQWSADDASEGAPLTQDYAWFWQKGQKLPHVITDNVYAVIKNQVKISSFLYLKTDPNEILLMTGVPNTVRPWHTLSAIIETDWYPASYPWHCVVDLDPSQKRITIEKGTPLCRLMPLRRDTYFAKQMSPADFDDFFERGQKWLSTHGTFEHEGTVNLKSTYVKQQARSNFVDLG